ncbi:glycosyl hydrolase family 26 [Terrimicrobium sacchariphilum]|uniref:Glycosyl hydrolase family 26 n=1 Tax=Terrimicrobium sacchariphilum TaxID=690879 RepID=A0A146G6Z9_TERSA|nr:glycosyl hydrolase [Terrimicrobium sacchariphilum]GAT32677.1 glycosyl hydrolase family 26 [Terrimicrobium sacchariphilum]
MGVYEGCVGPGIEGNERYALWLHRTNVWGHDTLPFGPESTWDHVSGKWQDWFYEPWSKWIQAAPGRRLVLSVPLLPGPPDGSGPRTGDGGGKPVSLVQGASGAYNEYFRELARTLVAGQLGNSILRLGWEWNGNWYAWKVLNSEDAHHFAAYWRQIVNTMRSVPGTENLTFDWNVTSGFPMAFDPMEAYPGNAFVDYIGIDVYDQTWMSSAKFPKGVYPPPPGAGEQEIAARHEAAWSQAIAAASAWGIDYWQAFADRHGKPLTIPEWGLIQRPEPNNRGGSDNPYFIQRMFEYIQDPDHHVYFASYFDFDAQSEGNSRISGVDSKPIAFPKSSQLYRALFELPASSESQAPKKAED